MRKQALLVAAALVAGLGATAFAHTPVGGLVVAVSPDGKTIVAGGDSRTLYVIDAASLEVKSRVWTKTSIWGLTFNKDGSKLIVEDTGPILTVYDTKSWQADKATAKLGFLSAAREADLGAALEDNWNGPSIHFVSLTDLSDKGAAKFEKGQRVAAFGIDPSGKKLAVIMEAQKDDSEAIAKSGDAPKDLKGLAREEWNQKNDGKTSMFFTFEVPSGKKLSEKKIFFSTSEATVFFHGEAVHAANYYNVNVKIEGDKVELFQAANSYNYGLGISPDHKTLLSGGLRDGSYTTVDGLKSVKFTIDQLPGWPEYWKGFAVHSDGTAYGTTTAYRLARIKPDGTVEKTVPVH